MGEDSVEMSCSLVALGYFFSPAGLHLQVKNVQLSLIGLQRQSVSQSFMFGITGPPTVGAKMKWQRMSQNPRRQDFKEQVCSEVSEILKVMNTFRLFSKSLWVFVAVTLMLLYVVSQSRNVWVTGVLRSLSSSNVNLVSCRTLLNGIPNCKWSTTLWNYLNKALRDYPGT